MTKKIVPIKYTSRDFNSIKTDLIEHAKRYYQNVYKDFNEGSFGSLMLDTTAYVGDILSFYLDYQANESFLETSNEFENIIKHGRQVGFKFSNSVSSTGIATFYISVPANSSGLGPNLSYAPILKKGSTFTTSSGVKFILNEDVRFDNPNNEVRVLNVADNGTPVTYAIKAKGLVISGIITSETVTVGNFKKFLRVELAQKDIVEILSVFDQEGNEYYEVDYLSQNVIFKSVTNKNAEDAVLAKEVLKPFSVPRRFVVDRNLRTTVLQFGASSDIVVDDSMSYLSEPSNAVLNIYGKEYISSDSFDPTRILNSDKMGVAPSNTTLTVAYRYNNSTTNLNVATNGLNSVLSPIFQFAEENTLSTNLMSNVRNSLEIINEAPLIGDVTVIDSNELKRRIENQFATQNRAVTYSDYSALAYSMPTKYGSIKRVNAVKDSNSLKRNLNLYVLCEGPNGKLASPNQTVKNNLKTWLSHHRMINDSIDILDGKIVNYSINFTAVGDNSKSKYDILISAIGQLRTDFNMIPNFGETFLITDVYNSLKKVDGIVDVVNVKIEPKVGGNYSDVYFDIKNNTSPDERYVNVPKNVIMELKYPNDDIKGTIL
jgi:hypothetical protein